MKHDKKIETEIVPLNHYCESRTKVIIFKLILAEFKQNLGSGCSNFLFRGKKKSTYNFFGLGQGFK